MFKRFMDKIKLVESFSMTMKTSMWIHYIILANENAVSATNEKILEVRRRRVISSIVFSASCLESFINEYAYEKLWNEWESIERLSLSDKWLVVIKLINNKHLQRSSM